MSTALPAAKTATAADQRARRTRAANALQTTPLRSQLQWHEFDDWPAWADMPAPQRDKVLWLVGAWAEAASLRRCLDGAVMQRLADVLGHAELARLLVVDSLETSEQAVGVVATSSALRTAWSVPILDAVLPNTGREYVLSALTSPALRAALRTLFWPSTSSPEIATQTSHAAQVVRNALQLLPADALHADALYAYGQRS